MTDGNREEAAHLLNIGERTLYRKIKEFSIPQSKTDQRRKTRSKDVNAAKS